VARFDVEVDGPRVVPRREGASSLERTRTDVPGLRLRAGRLFDGAYPRCGCDACDEQLDDVVEELRWHVAAITGGGLEEQADGRGPDVHLRVGRPAPVGLVARTHRRPAVGRRVGAVA
jgi:hypothetical protein